MFRLSRLSDYGFVVLSLMAQRAGATLTATQLARETALPTPTVAKVLKPLARAGVVASKRGAAGGYALERPAESISVAEILSALDGPVALTVCLEDSTDRCMAESFCPLRGRWVGVNDAVRRALEGISLQDLARNSSAGQAAASGPAAC